MTSDDSRPAPDVRFRAVGSGLHSTFRCAKCEQPHLTLGRRKVFVSRSIGKQFVCAKCLEN